MLIYALIILFALGFYLLALSKDNLYSISCIFITDHRKHNSIILDRVGPELSHGLLSLHVSVYSYGLIKLASPKGRLFKSTPWVSIRFVVIVQIQGWGLYRDFKYEKFVPIRGEAEYLLLRHFSSSFKTLIKYVFLLNFLHELLMVLEGDFNATVCKF